MTIYSYLFIVLCIALTVIAEIWMKKRNSQLLLEYSSIEYLPEMPIAEFDDKVYRGEKLATFDNLIVDVTKYEL